MIAEVVIANSSKELDKKFSYNVPDTFEVYAGARVFVPFGRGNKQVEGIVTSLKENSDYTKLKDIIKVIDQSPLCTPKLLELAEYIRNTTVCTYYQALRLVVASGSKVKTTRWISIVDGAEIEDVNLRSQGKKKLLDLLNDSGGTVDYALASSLVPNLSNVVKSLVEKGIITLDEKVALSAKSRLVRMVKATELSDNNSILLRRAPKQFDMLELLKQTGDISAADLVSFSNGSYTALNSLAQKGLVEFYDKMVYRHPVNFEKHERTEKFHLTSEQQTVLDTLIDNHKNNNKKPNLIRGVTGSGKTEVFLQIIDYFIKNGKQAIVLVPEISLTPQMVNRFVSRFGKSVSVLHSALSVGEKFDEWNRILKGEVGVAIGARSAVFAPFKNLGIIIIDEEHETTYKSDNAPRYDAKNVAKFRCENEGAMLVLASATPSVNSYYKATIGEYNLMEMNQRHNNMSMPQIKIVDMREELKAGNNRVFSNILKDEMDKNIKSGKQTILFLNRRGFNSFVMCRTCGNAIKCRNCSVPMTFHKYTDKLQCHYCGYEESVPNVCPDCGSNHIRYMGTGTEKIEEELKNLYGKDSYIRMDADTTVTKNSHEMILERFQRDKVPILVGTQMVTKGLDFPDVTLVGVLAADMSLNIDDFRASERTFCQITQVCGRAGRGDTVGRAVVQTYQPDHYSIIYAKDHDYLSFYNNEINIRKQLKYPPFNDIILIMMQGDVESEIMYELSRISNRLKKRGLNVLGPVPAPYSKIKNKYRWRILIKHHNALELTDLFHTISSYYADNKNQIFIDINPNSMN